MDTTGWFSEGASCIVTECLLETDLKSVAQLPHCDVRQPGVPLLDGSAICCFGEFNTEMIGICMYSDYPLSHCWGVSIQLCLGLPNYGATSASPAYAQKLWLCPSGKLPHPKPSPHYDSASPGVTRHLFILLCFHCLLRDMREMSPFLSQPGEALPTALELQKQVFETPAQHWHHPSLSILVALFCQWR